MRQATLPRASERPFVLRCATVFLLIGLLFSAPFAFFPKNELIGLAAFLFTAGGLALGGSLRRLTRTTVLTHAVAVAAAMILFLYHSFDLLYVKFMLSVFISFQFCLVDRRLLEDLRDCVIYYGARGAVLAIVSFALYFVLDATPLYRTMLPDGRSIPFFGLTNINFGFNNPEFIVFARPAFLFDEPGQFAHFVLLLLALIGTAGLVARRWRAETAMLVLAGLATFSLAFFIVTLIYLSTKITRWRAWLFVGLLCVLIYALWDSPMFEALKFRFNPGDSISDDNRVVSGDNRTREVALAFEAFQENPLLGAGWTAAERSIGHFAANPLGPLGYSGLMALLLYLPLLERLYRCAVGAKGFHQALVVLLVALFFSQRPYFYFPIFIFLMEILRRQIVSTSARVAAQPQASVRSARKPRGRKVAKRVRLKP